MDWLLLANECINRSLYVFSLFVTCIWSYAYCLPYAVVSIVNVLCYGNVDRGDLFGWGNSEYDQLSVVIGDRIQLNVPSHLPFGNEVGKITKAAAAGSMCAVLNGKWISKMDFLKLHWYRNSFKVVVVVVKSILKA